MSRARIIQIAPMIFWGALLAYQVWRGVNHFLSFKDVNPSSGFIDYLLSLNSGFWYGLLAVVALVFVGAWWGNRTRPDGQNRSSLSAAGYDQDDESKRLFSEAHGK